MFKITIVRKNYKLLQRSKIAVAKWLNYTIFRPRRGDIKMVKSVSTDISPVLGQFGYKSVMMNYS